MEVIHNILETQAILIANPHTQHADIVNLLRRRIDGYITATKFVMVVYNVHVDLLEAATKITPGKRSPTITSLDDVDFKAVSSLVSAKNVNTIMDQLHDLGATDILVLDLKNSRMWEFFLEFWSWCCEGGAMREREREEDSQMQIKSLFINQIHIFE